MTAILDWAAHENVGFSSIQSRPPVSSTARLAMPLHMSVFLRASGAPAQA